MHASPPLRELRRASRKGWISGGRGCRRMPLLRSGKRLVGLASKEKTGALTSVHRVRAASHEGDKMLVER